MDCVNLVIVVGTSLNALAHSCFFLKASIASFAACPDLPLPTTLDGTLEYTSNAAEAALPTKARRACFFFCRASLRAFSGASTSSLNFLSASKRAILDFRALVDILSRLRYISRNSASRIRSSTDLRSFLGILTFLGSAFLSRLKRPPEPVRLLPKIFIPHFIPLRPAWWSSSDVKFDKFYLPSSTSEILIPSLF